MDNQSPEMEKLSYDLRALMRAWVDNPDNEDIKARYKAVHAEYQRLLVAWKEQQRIPTS
ncbi:MAG: hypothetical protein IT305_04565 [Chloroflexi bacterium]|nr:hypothetical protein [Chloroflexota bacterium]